jgi:16S rRNA (cytosine967-C5)-methyltransferase
VSRAGSQQRTLLELLAKLRPHWRLEAGLPGRIDALLGRDRRLGSRDRRLYRELAYTALRYLPWTEPLLDTSPGDAARRIAWLAADSPAVAPFRAAVCGDLPPCPPDVDGRARVLGEDPGALSPAWLAGECPEALHPPLRDALLSRAPLWLRLQTGEPQRVFSEFEERGWAFAPSPALAGAVSLEPGVDVAGTRAYREGKIEIQDVGSQLILGSVAVEPGGHWLDACAGSGGKTLQLAALLGTGGLVTARDVRPEALHELSLRASRADVGQRIRVGTDRDPEGGFDGVLVDAPCSGSGTWRRAPHLRWTTRPGGIRDAALLQRHLLRANSARVRPGGLLVYATCSLCRTENEAVTGAFLRETPGFSPEVGGKRVAPPEPDGDAFFVASFRRSQAL